jgi:hypothetical protein
MTPRAPFLSISDRSLTVREPAVTMTEPLPSGVMWGARHWDARLHSLVGGLPNIPADA